MIQREVYYYYNKINTIFDLICQYAKVSEGKKFCDFISQINDFCENDIYFVFFFSITSGVSDHIF